MYTHYLNWRQVSLSTEGTHWHEVRTHIEKIHSLCPYFSCFPYRFRNCSNHGAVESYFPRLPVCAWWIIVFLFIFRYSFSASMCTFPVHAMTAWGARDWSIAQFIHSFGTKLRRVVSLPYRPLYPREKELPVPIVQKAGGVPKRVWMLGEEVNFSALKDIPQSSNH